MRIDTRIETITEEIAAVKTRLAERDDTAQRRDRIETHEQLAAARRDREVAAEKLQAIQADVADAVAAAEQKEDVETQLAAAKERRDALATRVTDREREVVATTNDHLDAVLDALEFDASRSIRLERVAAEDATHRDRSSDDASHAGERSQSQSQSRFRVRVERETDDGEGVTDRVANLSTAEREVVGIVLALAGYHAHDVADEVPIVVVDGVEAIDAPRLAALLEYITEHAPYVLAAVLPSDAADAALADRVPGDLIELDACSR